LTALRNAFDLSIPFHSSCWAIATSAFWAVRRLGELTVPSNKSFDPKFHVTRTVIISTTHNVDGSSSSSFRIPWTKTTKEEGTLIVLTARDDPLCPLAALSNHLSLNRHVPTSAPLFAYSTPTGWGFPTKPLFISTCQSIWNRLNMVPVHGHSFRIGGATELLLAGVPPEIVARQGDWSSLSFLLYWRKIESILPSNITNAYRKKRLSDISSQMEQYHIHNKIPNALCIPLDD
jgi:hypothetical protein